MSYSNLINNLEIKYLNNIINYGNKNNRNIDLAKETKENLEDKNKLFIPQSESENDKILTNIKIVNYSDDYLYQKSWTKISQIHKIIKIKEFVNKLLINKEEYKDELIEKLSDLVRKKVLTKKNSVNYDSIRGSIISIPNLVFKKDRYSYKE